MKIEQMIQQSPLLLNNWISRNDWWYVLKQINSNFNTLNLTI